MLTRNTEMCMYVCMYREVGKYVLWERRVKMRSEEKKSDWILEGVGWKDTCKRC